jgi:hypothetical protein
MASSLCYAKQRPCPFKQTVAFVADAATLLLCSCHRHKRSKRSQLSVREMQQSEHDGFNLPLPHLRCHWHLSFQMHCDVKL